MSKDRRAATRQSVIKSAKDARTKAAAAKKARNDPKAKSTGFIKSSRRGKVKMISVTKRRKR